MQTIRSREAAVRLLRHRYPTHKILFTAAKSHSVQIPVPTSTTVQFFGKGRPDEIDTGTFDTRNVKMGWYDDMDGHRLWVGVDTISDTLYIWCPQEGEGG